MWMALSDTHTGFADFPRVSIDLGPIAESKVVEVIETMVGPYSRPSPGSERDCS